MWMIIEQNSFDLIRIDNNTSRAFMTLLPVSLNMIELNGNEKYANLPKPLPVNPIQPKIIQAGDVMLYGSQTLVLFYKTFTSSYSYTPIGHVKDHKRLAATVGDNNKNIQFIHVNK